MQRLTISAILLLALGMTLVPLGLGCGGSNTPKKDENASAPEEKKTQPTAKTPIPPGDGVIKGKVVFAGKEPEAKIFKAIEDYKVGGQPVCLADGGAANFENCDQTWKIGKDKGLANVVVFLKTPKGKYFEASEADKKRTDVVEVDQPHCAFIPHVSAVFAYYSDGKKTKKTGQVFKVKNTAKFNHNTTVSIEGTESNKTLAPKDEFVLDLPPRVNPYGFSCNIHSFMRALVWSFDHPYFDVTKDDGNFEIKNVPNDVALEVIAWHESPEKFKTETITLKKGETKDLGTLKVEVK